MSPQSWTDDRYQQTDRQESVLSHFSRVQLFATPRTEALQAPLFMGSSWQKYWNEMPFLTLGKLPDPGIELGDR